MNDPARPDRPVYLDYHATTPVDPRVLDAMLPYFTEIFGNPHSTQHAAGWAAAEAVEDARGKVAALIGADPREVVFTSGATEANNIAIKGVAHFYREYEGRDHIVTAVNEHKCVLESVNRLEREGFRVTRLKVGRDGRIDVRALERALTDETALVSLMAAQNEVGVLAPMAVIGTLCRSRGVRFHTDAAQAAGKIPIDVNAWKVDYLSLTGHKFYGPKGIGALYVRRRPRARLEPLFDGGGQERGIRPGTLPPALCVGLGEASAIAGNEMIEESARLRSLRGRLLEGLQERVPDLVLNGDAHRRLPGNLNVAFPGIDGAALMAAIGGDLCVSSGAACNAGETEPSYVLLSMGVPRDLAGASVRFGLGRFTTEAEIDYAAERIAGEVKRQRRRRRGTATAAE